MTRLRAALAYVSLRRTKQVCDLSMELPQKTIHVKRVDFPPGQHKDIYNVLYSAVRSALQSPPLANRGMAILGLTHTVRRSCASGALVKAGQFNAARQVLRQDAKGERALRLFGSSDKTNEQRLRVEEESPKISALLKGIETMEWEEKGVILSQVSVLHNRSSNCTPMAYPFSAPATSGPRS